MLGEPVDEVGAHLHLADAGLGLGVGDAEAPVVAVVKPMLADAQVAQYADPDTAAPERLDDRAAAGVGRLSTGAPLRRAVAPRA